MPRIAATLIEQVLDSAVALDGRHVVLWFRTAGDGALPFAVPREQLADLIDRCALARAQCRNAKEADDCGDGDASTVTWWNAWVDVQSRALTIDLTFGSGGTLSFAFPELMGRALLATLQMHYAPNQVATATRVRRRWTIPSARGLLRSLMGAT